MTRNSSTENAAEVRDLHDSALLVLGYMNAGATFLPNAGIDFGQFFRKTPWLQGSLPRLQQGGVDAAAISFGVNCAEIFPGRLAPGRQVQQVGAFLRGVEKHSGRIGIARSVRDVHALRRAGKFAVLLHLTGLHLEGNIEMLHAFHAMGVLSIHPPFDNRTQARVDAWQSGIGLTAFAREVVREMERLHMVIDLAHASDRMFRDVLRIVSTPVTISHGTCRALSKTKRNVTDDQIRAVAETGGVLGIHFAGQLVDDDYRRRMEASDFHAELHKWEAEMRKRYPDPFEWMRHRFNHQEWMKSKAYAIGEELSRPALERIVENIDHAVGLVGVDHVGIGPDYDLGNIPRPVDRADKLINLTKALRAGGYSKTDIRKIWGANFLRVYRQVLGG